MIAMPKRLPRIQRGRQLPRPRLLLMPPGATQDPEGPWYWTLVDEMTPPTGGHWTPGEPLSDAMTSAGHDPVLVLPPASVTRFELTAPKGIKRDEWPLLVDRHRCDPGNDEPLVLERLGHRQGRLLLVGVSRSLLHGWQTTLARAGLAPMAWAPAFLGQPDPPEHAICALPAGDDWMLRWHDTAQDKTPGRCHWLTWPRQAPLPPPLTKREWYQPLDDEDTLAWLAFLGRHLPHRLPRLAPQSGRGRSSRRLPISLAGARAWLPLRRCGLIVALLLLHGGLVAWQGQQSTREAAERQLAARFISTPASADDASRRLAERTSALADLAQRRAHIEQRLAALSDLPNQARLQQLEVSGQRMRLSWSSEALSATEREALRSRLAGLGQLTDTPTQLTLELDLSATEQGGQTP